MYLNMTCMISQTEQSLGAPIIGPGQVLGYIIPRIPSKRKKILQLVYIILVRHW